MGRPRGGAAAAVGGSSGSDEKGRRTSTRERKELMASYNEDSSGSEYSEEEVEEVVSDYKGDSVSEVSLSEPESSGSEYGSKKKKAVSPKKPAKGKAVKKGRAPAASPKKRGRKAAAPAAKKASPAKKTTKTKSSPAPTRSRPQRGSTVTKRPRYKDRGSDSEEEESMELSDSDEVEELPQEESEEESLKLSDDGETETNSRKRKAPGASPKGGRGRKPKVVAENGKAEKKADSEEKVDEEDKKGNEETTNGEAKIDGEKMEVEESKREETDLKIVEEKEAEREEAKKEEIEDAEDNVSLKSGASSKEGDSRKNPIVTDYSSFSLECDKKTKTGDAWNTKISCWNVGGVRGWLKKGGMEYLEKEQPDIMCFQEAKVTEAAMPAELKDMKDYPHVYWSYSATGAHHGVGILSKLKPENVTLGLPPKDTDTDAEKKLKESFTKDGRLIAAEFDKFILVNAYVPNSGSSVKDEKRPKPYPVKIVNGERLEWDRFLREYVKELESRKPVIVTGDLNVAHAEMDLANPKTNACTAGFTVEEREGLTKLLDEAKLIDTFRFLYPDQKDSYTFWSYRRDARSKNIGWRLDYFLLSPKLQDGLVESTMRSKVLGSDHCPLVLFLHV